MKILKIDRRENSFEVVPESFDDLWHIEKLVEKGDIVSGISERKIKPKNEGEKAFKQKIFVEIEAEKPEFHEATGQLRVLGKVISAKPEEAVPHGMAHTIEVEAGSKISVKKKSLKGFHIERLERAKEGSARQKLLIVLMDDEEAELAYLRDSGVETKARIASGKSGKMFKEQEKGKNYHDEILEKINSLKPESMVVAGQSFEIQGFEKFLKQKGFKGKTFFEQISSTGTAGLNEFIKSGKMDKLLSGIQSAEEIKAMERLLKALGNGLAAIGAKEALGAIERGAAEEAMVSEKFVAEKRDEANKLLDLAEQMKTKIQFFSLKSQSGKSLEGMGGAAAILRYKSNW